MQKSTKSLTKGKIYTATEKFVKAVGVPYLLGKEILYEGLVKKETSNPRDGRSENEVYSFVVCFSKETFTCLKGTSMKSLVKLFDGQ